MSSSSPTTLLNLELETDRVPVLQAEVRGDPPTWVAEHRDALRAALAEHGAVLVRGLGLADSAGVDAVFRRLSGSLMVEEEAFAPRESLGGGLYSSTPWPPNQQMCMHHELSYRLAFPGLMLFACLQAPTSGGATAVASATAVLESLPRSLVERFEREGWLLTRNYHEEIGASVEQAFGTEDRGAVEAYCRSNGIEHAWQPDGGLRTWQRRSAVVTHPVSGRRCWFNQIAFLNEWTIAPEIREFLVDEYGSDGLPFTTSFGNGDPIGEEVVQLLNEVYETHTRREPWQDGDLMLVDNLATAHSREPFTGPRELVVGLADPVRLDDCAPTIEVTRR
jgi:alpha-ketoglutarate-dependent taurine dioxygenase